MAPRAQQHQQALEALEVACWHTASLLHIPLSMPQHQARVVPLLPAAGGSRPAPGARRTP